MNLLTIADGFGDSSINPPGYPDYFKWPEIIQYMTKNVNLINCSKYGAGNEYIINCLREHLNVSDSVLIQWAAPDRLDLILKHTRPYDVFWQEQIQADTVYSNNIVDVGKNKFWISSGTVNASVTEYHQKYISTQQHQTRSQIIVDYATLLLEKTQTNYGFMLSYDSDYLRNTEGGKWCWHEEFKGMNTFRKVSKYCELDLAHGQPIPLIHFDFIKQHIMPLYDLPWRSSKEIDAVESMLYRKHKNAMRDNSHDTH